MTVDFPDWMTQAQAQLAAYTALTTEIAAAIATGNPNGTPGGTPLLHGLNQIDNEIGFTLPANSNITTANLPNTRPGYLTSIHASIPAGATVPIMSVTFEWFSASNSILLAKERWLIPTPSSGTINVYGKGPTKGDILVIQFLNPDPAQAMTVSETTMGTTQHIARDDWRGDIPTNVPGYTAAGGDPFNGLLAQIGSTAVGAGSNIQRLLPLYAGEAVLQVTQSAAQAITISVIPVNPGVATPLAPVAIVTSSANVVPEIMFTMPRCPCILEIANTGSSSTNVAAALGFLENVS